MTTGLKRTVKRSGPVAGTLTRLRQYLNGWVERTQRWAWSIGRQRQISSYMASNDVRKLHIGAGPNLIPGWLNTDLDPAYRSMVFMDATKPFPFPARSFD